MVRKSTKPVISKTSITISFTLHTLMEPCLFMVLCAVSSTRSPADEMYSSCAKSKTSSRIDKNVFYGSLAVVDLDVILLEDTIANNIKMWDDSIEDFEMILAARDARLHEDIMARPKGYQYILTEGGRDFSGGQRQRMEIARVLAQDPTAIILDEATSALDNITQKKISDAIDKLKCTRIVIAHRLSTIRHCDRIVVLDKGRIVEEGTYEALIERNGFFAELVVRQR